MCGIAGVLKIYEPGEPVTPHHESIPDEWLDTLDESIKHRGPDGAGRFRDRATRPDGTTVDVALVHRRLSIIDHAGGAQPMVHLRHPDGSGELLRPPNALDHASEGAPSVSDGPKSIDHSDTTETRRSRSGLLPSRDPSPRTPPTLDATTLPPETDLIAVAFNGCIYNHRELRTDLEAAGHQFETDHADTEVLVHGWRAWGNSLGAKLDAMCAYAIWDRRSGDLLLGRDLAFEKPLLTNNQNPCERAFVFASTANSVVTTSSIAGLSPDVASTDWIGDWIRFGATDDPSSIEHNWPYRAMTSRVEDHAESVYGNKAPEFSALPIRTRSHGRNALDPRALDQHLQRAVLSRLEADEPLGVFLSGGIDSALISAIAKQAIGELRTFTVRMPSRKHDESEAAESTARSIGTKHETLDCDANPAEDLIKLIEGIGQPFGDSSLLPAFWVARAARQHIKVALAGDGGDELFGGYRRYTAARSRLGRSVKSLPAGILPKRDPVSFTARLARLIAASRRGYGELVSIFPTPELQSLSPSFDFSWRNGPPLGPASDPLEVDFYEYLSFDLLRKTDTASMAVALEVRCPFLARDLVDAAMRTPLDVLMPKGERKGLLKQIARQYLPHHIINRPKQGFAIPIGEWFRTDFGGLRTLLHDHLLSADPFPGLTDAGINIDLNHVRRLLREHDAAGERSLNPWHGRDHSQRLYMLLVLSIWSRWLARLRGPHAASPDRDPTGPATTRRTSE